MKKKSLIIWLCFYILEYTGALAIILANRENWIFNSYSAFPIFYALVCAFLVWYLPSVWNYRRAEDRRILDHLLWRSKNFDERQARIEGISMERNDSWKDPIWTFMSHVCIALIPFFLIFVFFFNLGFKASSCGIGMLIYSFLGFLYLIFGDGGVEKSKQYRQKRQKELEEQQKREELGKWK